MGDLSEAGEVLEASDDRLEHLRALLALGSALRRAGQRAAARVPLRDDTGGLPLLDLSARGIESDGKHK